MSLSNEYNNLTRSDATILVELYMKSINNSLSINNTAHAMFYNMIQYQLPGSLLVMTQVSHERDNVSMSQSNALTQHNIYKRSIAPFVAVSTQVSNRNENSSMNSTFLHNPTHDTFHSDKHSETSDMFFNSIKELFDGVNKNESFIITSKRIRTTIMKHINKLQSMQIVTFLSCAIHNYIHANQPIIEEVLGDNTYEYNECYGCEWEGSDYFYYCTSYGLNKPVCSVCVKTSEEDNYNDTFVEYEEYECNKCQSCEYFGTGYFYHYINNNLNTPLCIDCKLKNDIQIKYDLDNKIEEDDVVDEEEEDDEDDNDDGEEDVDVNNDTLECEECVTEWQDGWKKGWKAAMKQIKKFTTQQMLFENIHIPKCASCGGLHNLKKCNGSCGGALRYCSIICQKKDWNEKHKNECSK